MYLIEPALHRQSNKMSKGRLEAVVYRRCIPWRRIARADFDGVVHHIGIDGQLRWGLVTEFCQPDVCLGAAATGIDHQVGSWRGAVFELHACSG